MSNFHYYQVAGGEEKWAAVPVSQVHHVITEMQPMFVTVLSVSKLVEDLSYEEKMKLCYSGCLYFDFDSKDDQLVLDKVNQFLDKLEELRVDLTMCRFYATGGRGYHVELPEALFMERIPKTGVENLASIYREIALELCVDTLDLRVYSQGRGRMWRQVNIKRPNGQYKVPISLQEIRNMTVEDYSTITRTPRRPLSQTAPSFCVPLSIVYTKAKQKVEELAKRRAKIKPDPKAREKAYGESIQWMMAGLGIKPSAGFQEISTQLAIAATAAGLTEDVMIAECSGLIADHNGNGSRYDTPAKREEELRRMYHYMDGNLCYEFSVGAIKSLLTHAAPDLDGIQTSKEDVMEGIKEAAEDAAIDGEASIDEYEDVAKGVTLSRYGVYVDTEFGKKRVCALSFKDAATLNRTEDGSVSAYSSTILVNGAPATKQTLEMELFKGLVPFSNFAQRHGHAFLGNDMQVRILGMRFVEQAKKGGRVRYIVNREGVDLVNIPNHVNEAVRTHFVIWSDNANVLLAPQATAAGVEMVYAGYPNPRGLFQSDLRDAPKLVDWLGEPGHREQMVHMLTNLFECQRPEMLGKVIGWYTSCFWKQLFHLTYGKFPLLHVNGSAGAGKTETLSSIANLFYYQGEPKVMSPGTTPFALSQHVTSSASIPFIIDEYKPHEMSKDMHNKMKLMFRDTYNQRDVARGGGNRDSDDFRSLQFTQLSAPVVFIAEAAEDEAAVMERVVLVTVVRPTANTVARQLTKFNAFKEHRDILGIIGQYIAADVVLNWSLERLRVEFDKIYDEVKKDYLVTESDLAGGISEERLAEKQNAKERTIFNHTVAKFGMQQFRSVVSASVGPVLDERMAEMESTVFSRMQDLHTATSPEYVKVLSMMSMISHHVDSDRPEAIRLGQEYAYSGLGSMDCIEIAVKPAYYRYRTYCKSSGITPLFSGYEAFSYTLKDSPAYIKQGAGATLHVPDVYVFNLSELTRFGVAAFAEK